MLSYSRVSKAHERLLDDKEREELQKYTSVLPYHFTSILIRQKFTKIKELYALLKNVLDKQTLEELPLCVPVKGIYHSLAVYSNVTGVDVDYLLQFKHGGLISAASAMAVGEKVRNKFDEELNDPKKKARYETFSRTKKVVFRKDVMTIARILTRYTTLAKRTSDDNVALLASRIENDLRPMELQWATDVDTFRVMYSSGPPSCMTLHNHKFSALQEVDYFPSAFYAFIPGVKGAYITRNGAVTARAVCYNMGTESKPKWKYGRIYSDNSEMNKKFVKLLKEHGFSEIDKNFVIGASGEFRIPGKYSKSVKDYIAPYVYMDNASTHPRLQVHFDIPKKEFVYTVGESRSNFNAGGGVSYAFCAKEFILSKCSCCGGRVTKRNFSRSDDGKYVFCSYYCAAALGYAQAIDSGGDYTYCKSRINVSGTYYSSIEAAETFTNYKVLKVIGSNDEYIFDKGIIKYTYNGEVFGHSLVLENLYELKKIGAGHYEVISRKEPQSNEAIIDW